MSLSDAAARKPAVSVDTGLAAAVLKGGDRYAAHDTLIGGEACNIALVADGSGDGADSADWCIKYGTGLLLQLCGIDASGESILRAGREVFARANDEALRNRQAQAALGADAGAGSSGGCAMTLCVINRVRSQLTTLNVGCCSAKLFVHGRECTHRPLPLTVDHRSGRAIGGLGPLDSAVPSCSTVPLPAGGADLLICSDGVWDEVEDIGPLLRQRSNARTAAQLVVNSVVQATQSTQEDYGLPRDDASCIVLRISASNAPTTSRRLSYAEARDANRITPEGSFTRERSNSRGEGSATSSADEGGESRAERRQSQAKVGRQSPLTVRQSAATPSESRAWEPMRVDDLVAHDITGDHDEITPDTPPEDTHRLLHYFFPKSPIKSRSRAVPYYLSDAGEPCATGSASYGSFRTRF